MAIMGSKFSGLVDSLFESLGCTEELTRLYIRVALSDIGLFDRKQRDDGSENIAAFGEKGVLVRMNDKLAPLRNLVWGNRVAVNVTVEDSYADLSVYGAIARMCRAGTWPGCYLETPWFETGTAAPPEPDRWEDTPPDVAYPGPYWCSMCREDRMYSWHDGGAHCDTCGQFLFGPSLGSVRTY